MALYKSVYYCYYYKPVVSCTPSLYCSLLQYCLTASIVKSVKHQSSVCHFWYMVTVTHQLFLVNIHIRTSVRGRYTSLSGPDSPTVICRGGAASMLPLELPYDTIRDAILTCDQKPTWVSLIYRTEPTTKKCKTEKLKRKKRICSEVAVNSLGNLWSQSWRRKGRLWWEEFAEKEGLSLDWKSKGWWMEYW